MKVELVAGLFSFGKLSALLVRDPSTAGETLAREADGWRPSFAPERNLGSGAHLVAVDKHGFKYLVRPQFDVVGNVVNCLEVDAAALPEAVGVVEALEAKQLLPCASVALLADELASPWPAFARAVVSLRERRGLSIAEVARRARVPEQLIESIEGASAPPAQPSVFRRLGRALGVSADELLRAAGLGSQNDLSEDDAAQSLAAYARSKSGVKKRKAEVISNPASGFSKRKPGKGGAGRGHRKP